MKKLVTLFIFLIYTGIALGQVPSYKEVVYHFYSTYDVSPNSANSPIFQKKVSGWYIAMYDYRISKNPIKSTQKLWDKNSSKFIKLNFDTDPFKEDSEVRIEKAMLNYDTTWYALYPFYAYPGWDEDVINYFEAKNTLNADEYYALGRAYSHYGSSLLNKKQAFIPPTRTYDLSFGNNTLNAEQLNIYKRVINRSIENFRKTEELNPYYPTIVGSIKTKADNEHVSAFLDLCMVQNYQEALTMLPNNLYDEIILNFAKNTLNTCPKNALLITNGDNDTYPLLYAQAKLNYRPDVRIINISLLNLSNYIAFLNKPYPLAKNLTFSIPFTEYKQSYFDAVLIENPISEPQELTTFLHYLKGLPTSLGINYKIINYNAFYFKNGDTKLNWDVELNYLQRSSIALYDLVANNPYPVYFTSSASTNPFFTIKQNQIINLTYPLIDVLIAEEQFTIYKNNIYEGEFNKAKKEHINIHQKYKYYLSNLSTFLTNENLIEEANEVKKTILALSK